MTDRTPHTPPPPPSPPSNPPPDEPVRRSASPLLWILVLLALLAFGWFVYNQRAGETAAPEPPPPVIGSGDDRDAAAERERAADDARRRARDEDARGQPQARAPATPDRDPVPRARVEPDYPVEAYRAREEGTVLVSATVGTDGSPRDVQVLRRSGSRQLDRAAMDAVARWTFDPAIRGGRPAEAEVQVPVTFRIDR